MPSRTCTFLSVAVLLTCLLSYSLVRADCGLLSAVSKTSDWQDTFCISYNSDWITLLSTPRNSYPALAANESWNAYGCEAVGAEGKGKALLVERGGCTFYQKAVSANQSGAGIVVVINNFTDLLTPSDNGSSSLCTPLVIITDQDGKFIKDQLASLGDVSISLYAPQVSSWDPGQILIAAIAVLALITSTVLANNPLEFLRYGLLIRKDEHKGGAEDTAAQMSAMAGFTSGLCSFVMVVVVIVGLLALLYFFYYPMVYIVIGLFCVGAAESLYHCLSPFVALIPLMRTWRIPENKLWILRYQPDPRFFITLVLCAGLVVWWAIERNESYIWVLHDVLGFAYIIFIASVFTEMDIVPWYLVLLLAVLCLYDIVAVFITPYFTKDGVSVMEKAATGGGGGLSSDCSLRTSGESLPIVFTVPKLAPSLLISKCSQYGLRPYMLLGYGDVAVPALFVALCLKFDLKMHPNRKLKLYHMVGCFGYIIGLAATFLSLNLMQHAQPALLFLVPCILIGVLVTALVSGELCVFLTGRPFRGLCRKRRRVHAPKCDVEGKSETVQEGGDGKGEEEGCDIKEEEKEKLLTSEQQK